MSMIGNLARISASQLESLHAEPETITALIYPELEAAPKSQKPDFWTRIFGSKSPTTRGTPPQSRLADGDSIDLDKAWHCLHFLFTKTAWEGDFPAGFLVSCGKPIGDVDVGYGPARSFTPGEVEQISCFIHSKDESQLRASLDFEAMKNAEVYPNFGSDGPMSDEDWEYIQDAFRRTKAFVKDTAGRKMALLCYLN